MTEEIYTVIDRSKCTGCGSCVAVCPSETLSLKDGKARVTGERSIGCGHCVAVCPEGAVRVTSLDERAWEMRSGAFDAGPAETLVQMMRTRRSVRRYRKKPVDREILEDLVRIGTMAPSATNSQAWTFTILANRQEVERLGELVKDFFRLLNRVVGFRAVRAFSRVFMKDALGEYYRETYDRVEDALRRWDATREDLLFRGAPAAILVGGTPDGSMPKEDALLAAQNIQLAAHAAGLGTCFIGYVVESMARDPRIKKKLGIPAKERIYAVIAVGWPKVKWERPSGRRPVTPRVLG